MNMELVHDPETQAPAIVVGSGMFATIAGLIAAHPDMALPAEDNAAPLALAWNHLARSDAYEVIQDPAAFEAAYRAARAAEDPGGTWSQAHPRLSDFGMPDFGRIHAPLLAGEVLTFFARDVLTGLAYRVSGALKSPETARYEPMRLVSAGS